MDLAQDTDQWHSVLITVNVWIPQMVGNFLSRRMTVNFTRRSMDSGIGGLVRYFYTW